MIILKSVTIDGWVIIGILMVMAVISWMVMFDKTTFVNRQLKANALFHKSFRQVAADLTVLDHGDADDISTMGGRIGEADQAMMRNSSLYRIYHIGAEEIRQRFAATGRARVLSAQSIAAIRAALDGGLVRENQRLNKLIVLLTIAISGGPFLGLLGTVVGVMITFAAIAASGDVNVNAIRPRHRRGAGRHRGRSRRRDPGAVRLQLSGLPHQGPVLGHAGLRRRVHDEDGGSL